MNLIQTLEKEQMQKLSAGRDIPDFGPGDTLLVNVKVVEGEKSRVQAYEGVCIGRTGAGLNESFTVRKISYGEGVERVFPLYGPVIELDQGGAPRQGASRQAVLSARPARQEGPYLGSHQHARAGSNRRGCQGRSQRAQGSQGPQGSTEGRRQEVSAGASSQIASRGRSFGPFFAFIVHGSRRGYIAAMVIKAQRIILRDHARLPSRFYGRLTAVQAGL